MKRWLIRFLYLIMGLIILLFLAGKIIELSIPKGGRFKLQATATVRVDGVDYTGSAVQEFSLGWAIRGLDMTGAWGLRTRGEAVRIDIPDEEPIYVLISANTVFYNCADRWFQDAIRESLLNLKKCDVRKFPSAVRFDGSGDYSEAIAVHYAGKDWNGYEFVSMSFTRTNEPITEGRIPDSLWKPGNPPVKIPHGEYTSIVNLGFKQEKFF